MGLMDHIFTLGFGLVDETLEQVPERPPRLSSKNKPITSSSEDTKSQDNAVDVQVEHPKASEDPLLGIHSILSEMEREIRHTGSSVDPQDGSTAANKSTTADGSDPPRIGGLTIEEFIHFLALLERVKEQHLDSKEADTTVGTQVQSLSNLERTSPYDNIIRPPPEQPFYCHVATSPAASPPSDDQDSNQDQSGSSSLSPCSSDEDGQNLPPSLDKGIHQLMVPGSFSLLERLFLRRYLHVIPEEAASDCGSNSARLSRALSGLSSALSYLEDLDEDRFSNESMADETDPEGDGTTPIPIYPLDPANPFDPVDILSIKENTTNVEQNDIQLHSSNDEMQKEKIILDVHTIVNEEETSSPLAPSNPATTDHQISDSISGSDEYSLVTAMPAIIISSSDDDDRNSPSDEINRLSVSDLPLVLEELNGQGESVTSRAEENERTEADHLQVLQSTDNQQDDGDLACLADCELLDESSLPISVLMIHSSTGHQTGDRTVKTERIETTEADRCPCSLGLSDDSDSDDSAESDGHQQPEIIDGVDKTDDVNGQLDRECLDTNVRHQSDQLLDECLSADCRVGENEMVGETRDFHPGEGETSRVQTVETLTGTSVVTLIDARIVSVDYKPVQLNISSSVQNGHTLTTTSTIENIQPAVEEEQRRQQELSVSSSSAPQADGHPKSVGEMRKLWESRIGAESSSTAVGTTDQTNSSQCQMDTVSTEDGSDASTPVPEEVQAAESNSDSVRMRSIQEFRMLWSGWPPPPPLPPPPENYGGVCNATASETETGYSTDGSVEPFHRRRRMLMATPTPPPRPTPPRDENLYRFRATDPSFWNAGSLPDPPLRYQPRSYRSRALCYYSAPEGEDDEDDDERVKARLLADWLVLANRKRSQSPSNTYRSGPFRSNYSTLTSTTGTTTAGSGSVTRETSARESESEASDYDRPDTSFQRQRRFIHREADGQDWPHHGE